jgi:hypothetical protein
MRDDTAGLATPEAETDPFLLVKMMVEKFPITQLFWA